MTAERTIATRPLQPVDVLLCNVASGDRASFGELYSATCAPVYGLIRRVLVDASQSEEVTQEVFLEVWQLASRYNPEVGGALAWVLFIAHRRAIDRVRASRASRARDLKIGLRDLSEPRDGIPEQIEMTLEHARAVRAMRCLTQRQREALTLVYWGGLSTAEVADKLTLSRGTVSSRLHDGLRSLRREMDKIVVESART